MRTIDKPIAIAVILVSTILMQIHSIGFWIGIAGIYSGVALSLALEAAMLWLWYERKLLPIRTLAAFILIAGPWYQLSVPAVKTLEEKSVINAAIISIQEETDQLAGSLKQYDKNSGKRLGWSGRIDDRQEELTIARKELRERKLEAAKLGLDNLIYFKAVIPGGVLLIVLITQLTAIASLRNYGSVTTVSKGVTKLRKRPPEASDYDRAVKAVAIAIKGKLPEFGGVQSVLAKHYGFRPADVSMVLNQADGSITGSERISKPKLREMVDKLFPKKG